MYNTMHLTYAAREFDNKEMEDQPKNDPKVRGDFATNESQPVDRQILRMVLALRYVVRTPCKHNSFIGASHL